MLNRQSTFYQNLNNPKGQIALFVALIFQVLFLFFAMVINVGLLVHHKINLQNSVDLAAYYGAMRQAEGMNVIAHTNYQIRQSWKLLTWRYRMLGSAGDFTEHPFDKMTRGLKGNDDDGINFAREAFYNAPAFCITYVPFKPMPPDENTCKDLTAHSGIKVFDVPKVFIDLPGVSHAVRNLATTLRNQAFKQCRIFGSFNYVVLGGFVVAFNIDQANRSLLISYLSHAMSPDDPKSDFYDIDGKSVHRGIENTLKNNLTAANNTSDLKIEVYNSLGHANCNKTGVPSGAPAKWLRPVKIAPGFVYIDTKCDEVTGKIIPEKRILQKDERNWPFYSRNPGGPLHKEVSELAPYIKVAEAPLEDPYNFSIGVEKNPWCMAYVGVAATAKPKIPFSPFGGVTLKARAFYKPFGGRIGPWYFDKWTSREVPSKGSGPGGKDGRTDANLPPRVYSAGDLGDPTDPSRAANFSRFVGDDWGLKSRRSLYQYGRAIYGLDPSWQISGAGNVTTSNGQIDTSDSAPNFAHWEHLPFKFYEKGGSQDIMAWDSAKDQPSRMRDLEMSAILPDAFDFAYYSIEPNFYQNYYTRLRDGFLKGIGSGYYSQGNGQREFLGDVGTHKGYKGAQNYDEFSVKDQYNVVKNSPDLAKHVDIKDKLTYISEKWEHALTGWAPKTLMDYSLDANKLGKCDVYPVDVDKDKSTENTKVPTSGHCVAGGSTGYSVKMISAESLRTEQKNLGGVGVNGLILNPPPEGDFPP